MQIEGRRKPPFLRGASCLHPFLRRGIYEENAPCFF